MRLILWGFVSAAVCAFGFAGPAAADEPGLVPCPDRISARTLNELCGTVRVPRDHFAGDQASFELGIRWLESPNAEAASRPPVIYLNGGPGLSNLAAAPPEAITSEFNILLVGYRGIDGGPETSCPNVPAAITGTRRILEDGIARLEQAISTCIEGIESRSFPPRLLTVSQTIHDIAFVQASLRIDHAHILAGSFGTRLGLIYQDAFPDLVGRAVLIGANPPGHTIWRPDATDRVWQRVSVLCSRDNWCRGTPDEIYSALRYRVPQGGFADRFMDTERARVMSFLLAYDAEMMPVVADIFLSASRGDLSGLYLLALAHDLGLESTGIHWGHFVLIAAQSDFQADRDYCADLAPSRSFPYGSPLAQLFWCAMPGDQIHLDCGRFRNLAHSTLPTLLISGELDVSAPFEQIQSHILPKRSSSWHWIVESAGHYNLYGSELMSAAAEFLISGEVRQPAFTVTPTFGLPLAVTSMLWAGIGLALLVLVGLIALARAFFLRIRRAGARRG